MKYSDRIKKILLDSMQVADANEAALFARQLEYVIARTYDVLYPNLLAQQLIPVSNEGGPGATSITYRQYDMVGVMKLIAQYADDLPRVDVFGKEFTVKVKNFGDAYGYNIFEIAQAAYAGVPLEQRKANAARLAYEQMINRYAWFADGTAGYGGLYGLFYAASITKGAATNGNWLSGATADQIIYDINNAINYVRTLTKQVHAVNTVIMPVEHYGYIATTPRSSVSDTTILQFVQANHPGVAFFPVNECASLATKPSGGAGPTNIMVAYQRDPDVLQLRIPRTFEQLPVQQRNLEFVVNCIASVAGVQIPYPLAINLVEGI